MKLICAYDREKKAKADHKCDICGKLICSFCGYSKDGIDYCNECWQKEQYEKRNIKKIIKRNSR